MEQQQSVPNVLVKFAALLGASIIDNRLDIPAEFGIGYCAGYVFNRHIRMLVSDYELKRHLIVERPKDLAPGKLLFFKFQNIFPQVKGQPLQQPSVLIATSRINTDEVFTIHSNTKTINIEVDVNYLKEILPNAYKSPVLQSLLHHDVPLFFEQLIYQSLFKS